MRPARPGGMRAAVTIAAGLVSAVLVLAGPAPAFAHNYLVSSTPQEGGTLTELPQEFSVTTNEPLLDVSGEAAGFALQVRDADGGYYGDGCLTIDGATLSTPAALGEPGEYTIGWRVVSADGHTVDGEFAFTWEPAAGFEPAASAGAPPSCGDTGATGAAAAQSESAEPPGEVGAVSATDFLWVLGTVVVVAVVLLATLLLLTRRRGSRPRA